MEEKSNLTDERSELKKYRGFSFSEQELNQLLLEFYEEFRQLMVLANEFSEEEIESAEEHMYYQLRNMTNHIHTLLQKYDWTLERKKEVLRSVCQNEGDTFRLFEKIFLNQRKLEQNNSVIDTEYYNHFILLNYLKRVYGKCFVSLNSTFGIGCWVEMYQQALLDKVCNIHMWCVKAMENLRFNFSLLDLKRKRMEEIDINEDSMKEYHELCFSSGRMAEMLLHNMLYQWYEFDSGMTFRGEKIYTAGGGEVEFTLFSVCSLSNLFFGFIRQHHSQNIPMDLCNVIYNDIMLRFFACFIV